MPTEHALRHPWIINHSNQSNKNLHRYGGKDTVCYHGKDTVVQGKYGRFVLASLIHNSAINDLLMAISTGKLPE